MALALSDSFPRGYDYRNARWYKQICTRQDEFRNRVLTIAYLVAIAVPLTLIMQDLVVGDFRYLVYSTPALAAMAILAFYHDRTKKLSVVVPVSLFTNCAGFFLAALLPGGHGVYMLMFFLLPPLAFFLAGIRSGKRWSIGFFASVAVLTIGVQTGWVRQWWVELDAVEMIIAAIAYWLIFFVSLATETLHQLYRRQLIKQLIYDNLTGLPNKYSLLHILDNDPTTCYLAILRIDNFRDLCSLLGYAPSDSILEFVSDRLLSLQADHGFQAFHLGSHDFGLILREDSVMRTAGDVDRQLDDLIYSLNGRQIQWGGNEFHLSFRAGVVDARSYKPETALSKADAALSNARRGLCNVQIFDPALHYPTHSKESTIRLTELIQNRRKRTLRAAFQPIVRVSDGKYVWHEVLTRVRRGTGQYVSVAPYLELASATGLDDFISRNALDSAIAHMKTSGTDVSINISTADIARPRFVESIEEACQSLDGCSHSLILELVEHDELVASDECRKFIDRIKACGAKVAIDDFGSGYSNIAALLEMNMDIIKLDGKLVRRLSTCRKTDALVSSVVKLCNDAGIETVAEFVEDEQMLETIRDIGATYAQGYLFGGPPQPLDILSSDPTTNSFGSVGRRVSR